MAAGDFRDVLRSASFRRALTQLGLVWLFLSFGALLLLDRLSHEVRGGWNLRTTVVEWVDDAESEVCLRRGPTGLEVLAGGAARSIAAGEGADAEFDLESDGLGGEGLDGSDGEWEDLEPRDPERADRDPGEGLDVGGFDVIGEDGFDVEELDTEGLEIEEVERPTAGAWLCVTREALVDDGMEALMGSAFALTPPDRVFRPLVIGGVLWLAAGLGLVLFGAWRLSRGPVALVRDLDRVRRLIDDGQHASRLRRRDPGGDLDVAATDINAILDRLEYTITTLSEVSDNIAHDLRTPLTRLQGQLDLVRQSERPTSAMIDSVQEEAGQLLQTFNALLRIAHVKGGSRRKGFRRFDVGALARDAGELYAPAMAEKGLDFVLEAPPDGEIFAHGDGELWLQAISNLLDNAFKYTPEGGRVTLAVASGATRGMAAQFRVSDSGHGIPEGEIGKVLERFYRLASHRNHRGSGLGLTLVAAICDLHAAEITLVNRDGLTVLIDLPAREGGASAGS